jgi:hypothetical protein
VKYYWNNNKNHKIYMENIELKKPREISLEEQLEINHEKHLKELRISQMRSSVIRKQITEAYEILENIRFDYLGDTAFREKVVMAKKYLEMAFNDYLLNDNYWRASIKSHLNTTPVEFAEQINELPQQSEVVE